jgi:GTP-binding protein LepA
VQNIRNFSIIAHIDHGKSTLADRFLEITGTIEKRKMREQVLDSMELERERGITIKMQPVRMIWEGCTLNLIDTPGHIDFSYEVSRALTAVEGAILLIDATQGIQAQTLSVLALARSQGLVIVPALSKIDSPLAQVEEVRTQVAELLSIQPEEVLLCSGKTGEGVDALLRAVIKRVPPPQAPQAQSARALIFDFQYSDHQGVIVYLRMFDGAIKKGDELEFAASGKNFKALDVGIFSPNPTPVEELAQGNIGYVVTGIKSPGFARVGDTIRNRGKKAEPLPGYAEPRPVVWASVYPESQDDFVPLQQALSRLKLSDSSLSFEEEASGVLGRGFRCGFLGMLHLEIVTERLRREFNLTLVVTTPTITYEVTTEDGKTRIIYSPSLFPDHGEIKKVREPFVAAQILLPGSYVGAALPLLYDHEALAEETVDFGEGRMMIKVSMPLRELMRNFFDKLKSVTSGYASISYEIREMRDADVARLDLVVADEAIPAFARVVASNRAYEEAKSAVEKLYNILPRQQFAAKIQGVALGRILSSKTLPAMSKNVTQHMYGGDRTRKMKLWEKQKRGKAKLKESGKVTIPSKVFLQMVKSD